jgi:hypothetical protein
MRSAEYFYLYHGHWPTPAQYVCFKELSMYWVHLLRRFLKAADSRQGLSGPSIGANYTCGRTVNFLQVHSCNWGIIMDDIEISTDNDYEFTTSDLEYL